MSINGAVWRFRNILRVELLIGFPSTGVGSILGTSMKKIVSAIALAVLMSAPAFAADMPVKARPVVVDPVYDWSGFYIGGGTGGVLE